MQGKLRNPCSRVQPDDSVFVVRRYLKLIRDIKHKKELLRRRRRQFALGGVGRHVGKTHLESSSRKVGSNWSDRQVQVVRVQQKVGRSEGADRV